MRFVSKTKLGYGASSMHLIIISLKGIKSIKPANEIAIIFGNYPIWRLPKKFDQQKLPKA